ncbi:MAG: hypothetical protein AB8G18_07995 [Gammaproteobacteria bacterium]
MNIRSLFALTLIITTLFSVQATASEAQCLKAVKERHFERLTQVCVDLPHRNRLEKMRMIMTGDFTHYLGTAAQPSEAFALLKESAYRHDKDAQYMYSQLYGTAHTASVERWDGHPGNNQKISMEEYNANVKEEAAYWMELAAENGHTLALLEVAEVMLLNSYTNDKVNLRKALSIARRANEANPTLAASLIERLNKRIREF